jgi:hypothetical protein
MTTSLPTTELTDRIRRTFHTRWMSASGPPAPCRPALSSPAAQIASYSCFVASASANRYSSFWVAGKRYGKGFATAGRYLADDFAFDGPVARNRSSPGTSLQDPMHWRPVSAAPDLRSPPSATNVKPCSSSTPSANGKIQTEQILWNTDSQR